MPNIKRGMMAAAGVSTGPKGELWGWGYNSGNLGNGATSNISSPIQIGALSDWKTPAAGAFDRASGCIKNDGTLWHWGNNDYGQLGFGNTTNTSSPVQVGSLTDWAKHTCTYTTGGALKTDGTFWTWGGNTYGAQGNGTTTTSSSPAQIGSLTDYLDIGGDNAQMRVTRES